MKVRRTGSATRTARRGRDKKFGPHYPSVIMAAIVAYFALALALMWFR